ncbi:MAG TPA: DUF1569 domain-containing protein [Planctomycetota bacterium]|nr:DUF1569 domain-containing protein [Planctomycetota bacterium]
MTLFETRSNQAIVARIQALRPDSKALWGKMQVAQMLAHCRQPLLVATGELQLKRGLIGILFGKLAKKKLTAPEPFKRGLPTAPQFIVRDPQAFAEERARLIALVERFAKEGPSVLSREPHPFFGPLTQEEWDLLQVKHLDHHLRQFGA